MQVVVEINDKLYKRLFDNGVDNYDDAVDMAKAIRKGIPLPKGHGRLIDGDKLLDSDGIIADSKKCHYIPMIDVYQALTIIEKDGD